MSAVVITLHDVEPAVRLNAQPEKEGVKTEVVSPMDDKRRAVERVHPDVIVFTGDLTSRHTEALVQEQLWTGVPSIGITDVRDERQLERIRGVGYVELLVKPVDVDELTITVKGLLDRRRLQRETGLI